MPADSKQTAKTTLYFIRNPPAYTSTTGTLLPYSPTPNNVFVRISPSNRHPDLFWKISVADRRRTECVLRHPAPPPRRARRPPLQRRQGYLCRLRPASRPSSTTSASGSSAVKSTLCFMPVQRPREVEIHFHHYSEYLQALIVISCSDHPSRIFPRCFKQNSRSCG